MAFATATDAQIQTAYKLSEQLSRMLQEYVQGDATQTARAASGDQALRGARKGRFAVTDIQAKVTALNTALVALTA